MNAFYEILANTVTLPIVMIVLGGTVFGTVLGAIPGLSVNLAVAIMIPATFYMSPVEAMALLIAIYKSGTYGGSVSAILLGTPGTPAASATVIDGYAMAKKGQASKALNTALFSSAFADVFSNIVLIIFAAQIAKIAIQFGPAEYTLLILFSLIVIGGIASDSLIKGILASLIGLSLAVIGMDPMTGNTSFTFGSMNLLSGIPLVPMLIGLFAISEVLGEYSNHIRKKMMDEAQKDAGSKLTLKEFIELTPILLKSSALGVFIGALPGSGSATAAFLAYSEAKRTSKHPEEFGKGSIEGVAACEAGNNAVCGATLIPLLTLGIPGDTVTAIMFGALILQGITPGPLVFEQQGDVITGIYITLFMASISMVLVGVLGNKLLPRIMNVKRAYLFPVITALCVAGTYAMGRNMFDVLIMMIFGVLGYVLKCIKLPVAPIIIGFILSSQFVTSLKQAMIVSDNSLSIFVSSPICLVFIVLIVAVVAYYIQNVIKMKKRGTES
ncbi:tripartite tricarboxylate transporter permease [Bengtsoniella intestinalis]|uniref:tripartite tricarboxylate transporter permease n=1 Tax=Bengtsoniella intestinalis TaxID=3073143 RepID=UPI00391F0E72